MSQDMCFTMMLSILFSFKFIFMQCYFDFRCFWWVVEHVWTLQRCSKISKILVCKAFKWLLLILHCLFWERWLILSTGTKTFLFHSLDFSCRWRGKLDRRCFRDQRAFVSAQSALSAPHLSATTDPSITHNPSLPIWFSITVWPRLRS